MKRFLCVIALCAVCLPALASETFTVIRVVDGDTIKIWDARGRDILVRLIGVDTPESRLEEKAVRTARRWDVPVGEVIAAGETARSYLTSLIPPGSSVQAVPDDREYDDYGRLLAYVYAATGQCVNEALLREGYAMVFRREPFHMRSRYLELEATARQNGRGFWKTIWQHGRD